MKKFGIKPAIVVAIIAVAAIGALGLRRSGNKNKTDLASLQAVQTQKEFQPNTETSQTAAVESKVTEACKNKQPQFSCYDKYYADLTEQSGVAAAIADLKGAYQTDAYAASSCHALTHVIGRTATIKYPDITIAYEHGDNLCAAGYYHGVMEAIVAKKGRAGTLNDLNSICAPLKDDKIQYSFNYYNCVHGMGHGLMSLDNDDIPTALSQCDTLNGVWEENSCYSGVFMENIVADGINHITKYLKTDDLMYPCDAVITKYKDACYLIQTSHAGDVLNFDFNKLFSICSGVETAFKDTCYQSLGRDASSIAIFKPDSAAKTCLLGKDFDQQSNCAIGAAKSFVSNFNSLTQANQFCNDLNTADMINLCNNTAKDYYTIF